MRRSHAPSVLRGRADHERSPPVDLQLSGLGNVKEESVDRYFQVLFGRMSTKRNKTYGHDGILKVSSNTLTLLNEEGVYQCSTLLLKSDRLEKGSEIVIEPQELLILRELGGNTTNRSPPRKQAAVDSQLLQEFIVPRIVPSACPVIKQEPEWNPRRVKTEPVEGPAAPPSEISSTIRSLKTEREDRRSHPLPEDPVATSRPVAGDPLVDEAIILLCVPTDAQIALFDQLYWSRDKMKLEDEQDFLRKLKGICNGPLECSGKGRILMTIVEKCIQNKERVLVVAEDDLVLRELSQKYERSNVLCQVIRNEEDLLAIEAKVLLIQHKDLSILKKTEVLMDRACICDTATQYGATPTAVADCTLGPVYHLITAGTVEERLLQIYFGIGDAKDLFDSPSTEDYLHGSTSHLLRDDSPLSLWEQYPGGYIPETLQQV